MRGCCTPVRASGAAPGMLLEATSADHCNTQISLESSHFHQCPPFGPRYVSFDSCVGKSRKTLLGLSAAQDCYKMPPEECTSQ